MIRIILIIVIGVLALSFFGISLRSIVNSPIGQENIQFVWQLVTEGWQYIVSFFTAIAGLSHGHLST